MPIGGAETLLMNLVRRLDRKQIHPEVACLKDRGPLGDELVKEIPVHSNLLAIKFDLRVLYRLWKLMRTRRIDAVVTVGAGDKMFWGRLAARMAGVRVVISALHSTGWPDSVGRLNRLLTPLTDAFVGVAQSHSEHLVEKEGFPATKVHTIFNGVDTKRFCPGDRDKVRRELGLPLDSKVVAILAALRPEKNHALFLEGAAEILRSESRAQFLIIGDGPLREHLELKAQQLGLQNVTHFLGSRSDVEGVLQCVDAVALTSHNEASPVSILEALSCSVPVVAANVGSVGETVIDGITGKLFAAGDSSGFVACTLDLLDDEELRTKLGAKGRERTIKHWSLESMVHGYESLICSLAQPSAKLIVARDQVSVLSSQSHTAH
ncbi:glycosyltransferase [Bythopirellula polymerisocia]|nr:glycosyltransferase [Bythopirellula polymerisocia]